MPKTALIQRAMAQFQADAEELLAQARVLQHAASPLTREELRVALHFLTHTRSGQVSEADYAATYPERYLALAELVLGPEAVAARLGAAGAAPRKRKPPPLVRVRR